MLGMQHLDVGQAYPLHLFSESNTRVKVRVGTVLALSLKESDKPEGLLLARSARAASEGYCNWFTLPQEGKTESDGKPIHTVVRGLKEEFGWKPSAQCLRTAQYLKSMRNVIPSTRPGGGFVKGLLFIGMQTDTFFGIPNATEVAGYIFVHSWTELHERMAQVAAHRVEKYKGTCEAVLEMCRRGQISWGLPKGLA